jgi:ribulose-phosphate 3-epimerase
VAKAVPTILAETPDDFAARIDRVKPFASRIHVDFSDGQFTPVATIGLAQMYGIEGAQLDLHMMVNDPTIYYENTLALEPDLVIIHAESQCEHAKLWRAYKQLDIRVGLAILQDTKIDQVKNLLAEVDYLLVFCGTLGYNHGKFDATVLDKIQAAKAVNPSLEVAVDGGIDQASARLAVEAGADVLNSGSFIHDAPDPEAAYIGLEAIASGETA